MNREELRQEIRFQLTGGMLELELRDSQLDQVIDSAMRELQRYICSTSIITIPYKKCIDLSNIEDTKTAINVSSVSRIYRAESYMTDSENENPNVAIDPMQASQWQLLSGTGNMFNFEDYALNFASWNTMLQIRNTTSTDLAFFYDKSTNKLYINVSSNPPSTITIEYVPKYTDVEQINSDYWIDVLVRLCVALLKVTLGRIRSRYTQSNAIWMQDGQNILQEGLDELHTLRDYLQANTQLCYPID